MATDSLPPLDGSTMVSVVIPAFNSSIWIEETLQTVVKQSIGFGPLEVILVDDGSKDDTAKVAERFLAATSLKWRIIRKENGGPSSARNIGWRTARGRWIQFLDADDLIDPEKIETQYKAVAGLPIEPAVVYSSWRKFGVIDARWEDGRVHTPRFGDDLVADLLVGDNAINPGNPLFSRHWLERVGGWDERYTNGEDHDLLIRLALAGGAYVHAASDRPFFFYRRHGLSLSTSSGRKNAEVWPRLARLVEDQSRSRNELTPVRLARLVSIYGGAARWLADYDWTAAQEMILHVQKLDPNYRPDWSQKFRLLSSAVGYRNSIWLASRIRRLFSWVTSAPQLTPVAAPQFSKPNYAGVSSGNVAS